VLAIPYIPQDDPNACGAACLCMVYRSLGIECEQSDVLAAVSRPNARGATRCWTNLMCRDALSRGLAGLIVQARAPAPVPRTCLDASLRVIVNHRLNPHDRAGHFSVLVAIDEDRVVLHDPLTGPERTLWREEFLALWTAGGEVVGQVLLTVGRRRPAPNCSHCGTALPEEVRCPLCRKPVPLLPGEALGCGRDACGGRLWRACHCPWCDYRIEALGDEPWRPTRKPFLPS
jgi:hypothetical protein